jgi:hypothetical protein
VTRFTVETRAFRAGDEDVLLAGIQRARRASGGGPERALDELRWRYRDAPHGACVAFALGADGMALGGVAATRHRARLGDDEVFFLEVGDVFDDFASGAGLARARPLLAAGRAFAEEFGGFAPEKHPVMDGVPDRRAHRLGLKHLGWEVLRSENRLVLELARAGAEPPAGDVELEEPERFPPDVERAFAAYAAGRLAVLVRDAAYLDWRYAARPGFARAVARRAGACVGAAVVRGGWLHELVAAPDDEATLAALLAWARARARADARGASATLSAVVPDTAPEWLLLQRRGFRVAGTDEYLCFRSFQRPAIMSWLFHHWSYSRGDTLR